MMKSTPKPVGLLIPLAGSSSLILRCGPDFGMPFLTVWEGFNTSCSDLFAKEPCYVDVASMEILRFSVKLEHSSMVDCVFACIFSARREPITLKVWSKPPLRHLKP